MFTFAPQKNKHRNIMQENLVIVESPAKAKTIEKFLGKDYKVMSSYGHIRDLKKKEISIDLDTLMPVYEIPDEKKRVVNDLKANAKNAKKVWLASDEDREGEAISWHLCEVLGLDEKKTSRIVFHEITKNAILEAIQHPRQLDMNLTNAQQARRVLDRLVGFNLSPVLWRKVKPSLSAGRVQSVAVRLIVEREREIQAFKSEPYFRINAIFAIKDAAGNTSEIRAELDKRFTTHEDAVAFLEKCRKAKFTIDSISKKPLKRTPAPPFTTSTLQQEASKKLGFSKVTILSNIILINVLFPFLENPVSIIFIVTRPTYMENTSIEGTLQERRLYELIWKRTAATQMADAQIEKTTVNISVSDTDEQFIATGEVVVFDGFLKVYRESDGDDDNDKNNEEAGSMPASMKEGDTIERVQITSLERASMGPIRYTEASLVHKLEELGIGRPSTYAPTISTIQQREYVQKGDKKGEEREYTIDTLKGNSIKASKKTEMVGSEKGKLLPTDIGIVVNDFLMEYFPGIMDYNFTANVEEKFDSIAEGKENWSKMLKDFYKDFAPEVEKTINSRSEHKAGERVLGEDPKSHKPVSVKIGRFGPVVQIGSAEDEEKPRFAQLPKDKSLETITLEEALELFRLPRTLDEFEGETITIGAGRFGPYVQHNRKYVSIPKDMDPLTITREQAIELIEKSRDQEKQRHVKTFEEDAELEVMNGRYGPYICYKGKNYRMPKNMHERAAELTYEQCMEIVNTPVKTKK